MEIFKIRKKPETLGNLKKKEEESWRKWRELEVMEKGNNLRAQKDRRKREVGAGMLPFGFALDRRCFYSTAVLPNSVLHMKI